ncbi:uncharacterized protein LOC101449824 [Ceratitis capitata]|uniref:(Mediterranean fruit fly) hypothetical protein n=1 Tax=Ceratitis capitata TaxID=7213 RepID=A0A811UJ79_CERCA|nr:uncharacterized protein LOC101449824 [Ceratitis capitata]CAD6998378.1 unnamed protein product [Ceratitis capitata]
MSETPRKKIDLNSSENLTPVRFLDSPRAKSSSQDASITSCKSRLEVIVPLLQSNYSKWQLAQKRGLLICTSIEAIKTRALAAMEPSKLVKDSDDSLYPKDLKAHVDKLNIILSIFEDITLSAGESLQQLKSLSKLVGSTNAIFFRSWQLSEYINFTELLHTSYRQEKQMKQIVARELPHCMNRAELIRWTTAWEYPQYIDDWTSFMFAFLKEENK